jgi:ABC-type multidrug transport system fused ATPase/permease subunit
MTMTIGDNIKIVLRNLTKKQKFKLLVLIFLMIFSSLMEGISISSVMIYLSFLTSTEAFFNHPNFVHLNKYLKIYNSNDLVLPFTIFFLLVIFFAIFTRYLLIIFQTKIVYSIHTQFSVRMYVSTLFQPYSFHIQKNSSELITGIERSLVILNGLINPFMSMISGALSIFVIITTLFLINSLVAISALIWFGGLYFVIALFVKKRLNSYSIVSHFSSIEKLKILQEGLGGIRDILINGSQKIYGNIFEKHQKKINEASSGSLIFSQSPRLFMEFFGILFICIISYLLIMPSQGLKAIMPVIGSLVLSAQRLLPALQNFYTNWASIVSSNDSVSTGLNILQQPIPSIVKENTKCALEFNRFIKLENISFRYTQNGNFIFENLDLILEKGKKYGFIGKTGSGKSTLLDLIMGLLRPTQGSLIIDDQIINENNLIIWQKKIAHVPQSIFLSDTSIEENIAFGVPPNLIDHNKVRESAEKAQISQTIENLPQKYRTITGERGIKLSGGQRQRIGIARALYKNAEVIIFDEATSALDGETELAVIDSIESLSSNLTILIIAHRLSTLNNCDQIFLVEEGKISTTKT